MKVKINPEIFAKYAPLKVAVVVLENIDNHVNIDDWFNAEYAEILGVVQSKLDGAVLAEYPVIKRKRVRPLNH